MAGQGDKYSNFVEFTLADLFRSLLLGVRCNQARLARFVVNTRTGMIYLIFNRKNDLGLTRVDLG